MVMHAARQLWGGGGEGKTQREREREGSWLHTNKLRGYCKKETKEVREAREAVRTRA